MVKDDERPSTPKTKNNAARKAGNGKSGNGKSEAVDELMPLVYQELRRVAARHLERERHNHTLQPTALVHEAYLRLVDQRRIEWRNRAHFLAIASQTMRNILVEHARRRGALKRAGPGAGRVPARRVMVELVPDEGATPDVDVLALDQALNKLDGEDQVKRQVVELRFFGGLSIEETASALQISTGTVKRHWTTARAWLYRELLGDV